MKQIARILVLLYCFMFCCDNVLCQERTLDEVRHIVYDFYNIHHAKHLPPKSFHQLYPILQIDSIRRGNQTYAFVVNIPNEGWMILSNDTNYMPIIGYSESQYEKLSYTDLPDACKDLIQHHINMIDSLHRDGKDVFLSHKQKEHIIDNTLHYIDSTILLQRGGVWNQWGQSCNNSQANFDCDRVFNKFCPTTFSRDSICNRTIVGCSAVAIAQLMWYWQWPDYADVPQSIDWLGITHGSSTRHYYDWDAILPEMTNSTELYNVDAIAGLLRDCGYLSHMHYWLSGSYAGVGDIINALEGMGFHTNRVHEYSNTDIENILINEILQFRPVLCQAWESVISGHSFIIDGYKSTDNKFHINWGWRDKEGWFHLGFDGYDANRTFVTEVYPDCSTRSDDVTSLEHSTIGQDQTETVFSTNDVILGGNQQIQVDSGGHLIVQAGNRIELKPGFRAEKGSNVSLTIREFCNTTGENIKRAKAINPKEEDQPNYYPKQRRQDISNYDDTKQIDFVVYPNPSHDIINISSDTDIQEIKIYNLIGTIVLTTNQTTIDISSLPYGVYIIHAIDNKQLIYQSTFIHY